MTGNAKPTTPEWDDDDLPEWTQDQFDRAEFTVGGIVIRPGNGTLTKPGRPPLGDEPKKQVTLRLDADLLERFRATGAGWQSRINATLRKAVGI